MFILPNDFQMGDVSKDWMPEVMLPKKRVSNDRETGGRNIRKGKEFRRLLACYGTPYCQSLQTTAGFDERDYGTAFKIFWAEPCKNNDFDMGGKELV
jgi:hypothetical protein